MTTPHFDNNTASRLRSSALLLLLSGMCFAGCGKPAAPKIKDVVVYQETYTSTRVYSYTNDNELESVVHYSLGDSTEDQIHHSYNDGELSKLEYHFDVPKYRSTRASKIMSLDLDYSEDLITGLKMAFSDQPGEDIKARLDYNSDDTFSEISFVSSGSNRYGDGREEYSFEYTSDSLFDKVRFRAGSRQSTTDFEYNSEDLISQITYRYSSDRAVDHEFSYNDDGQLVDYETRDEECELFYNEDGLVKEVDCSDRWGNFTTYEINYYQDESVEGMTPRMPGIGFGDYFSLDGRPLTPDTFVEPMSLFNLLPH